MATKIEWVQNPDGTRGETLNPWVGCTPVSPGCANCYARRLVEGRLRHLYPGGFGTIHYHMERLKQLSKWQKGRMVFMWSMGDPFDDRVPPRHLFDSFRAMALASQHTCQVLTKRPERMNWIVSDFGDWWPSNVWAGVSVENQEWADKRLPLLAAVPAKVRFVSLEPLLGPVDLSRWLRMGSAPMIDRVIDWVIVGGESGPNARPMHPQWPRHVRDQCAEAGVPFFFKQWGEYLDDSQMSHRQRDYYSLHTRKPPYRWPDGTWSEPVGKKAAGHLLDGKEHREWPERSDNAH